MTMTITYSPPDPCVDSVRRPIIDHRWLEDMVRTLVPGSVVYVGIAEKEYGRQEQTVSHRYIVVTGLHGADGFWHRWRFPLADYATCCPDGFIGDGWPWLEWNHCWDTDYRNWRQICADARSIVAAWLHEQGFAPEEAIVEGSLRDVTVQSTNASGLSRVLAYDPESRCFYRLGEPAPSTTHPPQLPEPPTKRVPIRPEEFFGSDDLACASGDSSEENAQ